MIRVCMLGLIVLLLFGCGAVEPELTETEVIEMIEGLHSNSFGNAKVIAIKYERNRYVVEWENEGNCEWGVDHVDGVTGEVEMAETTIC